MADATDSLEGEIWKPVPGYEGVEASSLGRIKIAGHYVPAKCNSKRYVFERITCGSANARGYLATRISGQRKLVHQLVCAAFHGPKPSSKHMVAHDNDVKADNRPENLRWATHRQNCQDAAKNGRYVRGELIGSGKLTADQVREIRRRHNGKYGIGASLAREFGIRQENIIAIVKRRSWTHID